MSLNSLSEVLTGSENGLITDGSPGILHLFCKLILLVFLVTDMACQIFVLYREFGPISSRAA